MVDERTIQQVLSSYDIVEYIERYVKLTRKGSNRVGLCPFHSEKTGSFTVSASRQRWHCFGCGKGGNLISFVMEHDSLSFPDAVRHLAKEKGISVDEREESAQDVQERMKRESMLLANRYAQEYFVDQLKQSEAAQRAAYARWPKEFCCEMGVGYAPHGWDGLLTYLKSKGVKQSLAASMGLLGYNEEKNRYYDFYRDRITIPVRDMFGNIITFTCRDISGADGVAKYLNGKETQLFSKQRCLFGIDVAHVQASKERKFYLVEGAPDAMRLHIIGVPNAVACLGSSWNDEHWRQLKRYADTLVFIPDNDVVKKGEPFGTGVKSVIKYGASALAAGFDVYVKELPDNGNACKTDADSELKSMQVFGSLEEKDYILWYAKKNTAGTDPSALSRLMSDVCSLLTNVTDESKENLYLTELSKMFKTTSLSAWKRELKRSRKQRDEHEKVQARKIDSDLLEKYGFYEENSCYYSFSSDKAKEWSNFVLKPLFHIKDALNPKRLFHIRNYAGAEEIIELKIEDLVSIQKFKLRIEGLGNYIWQGSDSDLTKLKKFLYEQTETAQEITQLGWHADEFFAYGNGCYSDGMWHSADEYGIVRMPNERNYYLPSCSRIYAADRKLFQYERSFVHLNCGSASLRSVAQQIRTVYGNNGAIGFAFLLSSLFRDVITSYTKSFPMLNMFGQKGAGKSELGHTLMSFFVIKNTPPNISNATVPALSDAVSKCANALVHLDEFKNDIDLNKREFLKGLWDGTGRSRMNMDKDKKMEMTAVDCGVMISGQELASADVALFSRFVFLRFTKTSYSDEEKASFARLHDMQSLGFSHLTLQILRFRMQFQKEFSGMYDESRVLLQSMCSDIVLEDRILNNWSIPLASYKVLGKYLDLPYADSEMTRLFADSMKMQQGICKDTNEVSKFWESVSVLIQEGQIYKTCDYDIKTVGDLTLADSKGTAVSYEWAQQKRVLFIRPSRLFTAYLKQMRQIAEQSLPRDSLKYYLENSVEFLGYKKSMRFCLIINGIKQVEVIGPQQLPLQQVDRALCFDYDRLKDNYGIDLDITRQSNFD